MGTWRQGKDLEQGAVIYDKVFIDQTTAGKKIVLVFEAQY
jgi:hypothetical protein